MVVYRMFPVEVAHLMQPMRVTRKSREGGASPVVYLRNCWKVR